MAATPRSHDRVATFYRAATSGLSPVRARPLTDDARALLNALQYGKAWNTSVTRAELLARVAGTEQRRAKALALVEAHDLLGLRPVGNLVLLRVAKAA